MSSKKFNCILAALGNVIDLNTTDFTCTHFDLTEDESEPEIAKYFLNFNY